MNSKKVIIIGAGIAGLAAGIRLSAAGFTVEIIESASHTGGKISEINENGFRFDTGPSLFTLPSLLDELTDLLGHKKNIAFEYEKLPLICRYFWRDGTVLDAFSDTEKFAEEMQNKIGVPKVKTREFLSKSEKIYDLTADIFLRRSLHEIETYCSKAALRGFFSFQTVNPFGNMHRTNELFFNNQKAVQIFDRFATYNGSNPYSAPATLNVIPHLEHNIGAFFPKNGMKSIARHLENLAQDCGVKISLNEKVLEIECENKKVKSVRTEKRTEKCDFVLCNTDMRYAYSNILPKAPKPKKLLNAPKSSSALIFYWAMNGHYPALDLHNILFSDNYAEEFAFLFDKKDIYNDPTIYIFISSKFCAKDAPQNAENWFVMVNAPENCGQDWDSIIDQTRKIIEDKIAKVMGISVTENRLFEKILDPRGIEEKTSSSGGSLYGNSSNSPFSAFLRHPNFSGKISGLYFAGGSVHPGGGIPLCLLSAKIASEMIVKKNKSV
jgi:phytoene desaturase